MDLRLKELSADPMALVTLPWRLHAGSAPATASTGWSPTRISLLLGWIALVLALIASAVLVRGVMKLSDRRATFVSSVTHELRTPLTTFHLYSDMLAEGMVTDEEKKKGYLTTMRREAERLNHLVENVLAYSRVERGSARAQHQAIALDSLVERMRPRLVERTRKDEAELVVEVGGEGREVRLETDLTAVEQIVFNLVDNACKYGLPETGGRNIHLRASDGGRTARIEVCDEGGGIARADFKKLFRPFHKSAREAAHSKPGVGLGLALCRRLARELGGDLWLESNRERGACFVLELPVSAKG
jgi:signal transduction histidine kinase